MGYDGIPLTKDESIKLRSLLEKSNKFIIVKSVSHPTMDEGNSGKVMVGLEDNEVWTHDTDSKKLDRFLKKNNIKD